MTIFIGVGGLICRLFKCYLNINRISGIVMIYEVWYADTTKNTDLQFLMQNLLKQDIFQNLECAYVYLESNNSVSIS